MTTLTILSRISYAVLIAAVILFVSWLVARHEVRKEMKGHKSKDYPFKNDYREK